MMMTMDVEMIEVSIYREIALQVLANFDKKTDQAACVGKAASSLVGTSLARIPSWCGEFEFPA